MSAFARRLVVSLALCLTGAALAGETTKPEEIARAIRDLGAVRFGTREKASAILRGAGEAAEPALKEAAKSKDVEVSRRAKEILDEFKWGIYPETPKGILQQIQAYRSGNEEAKSVAVGALARLGSAGYVVLLKMTTAEGDAARRTQLTQFLAREVTRAVPTLLLDGKEETAERVLEVALDVQKEAAVRHYAAFLLQRQRLDAKIPHYRALAAKPKATDAAWVLSYLYRAKGDLASARQTAEKANDRSLVRLILGEEGNWKELAARLAPAKSEVEPDLETLALRAAYQRMAGQTADFDKTIAAIQKACRSEPVGSPVNRLAAKALFLNDRPADGLALLLAKKETPAAFEVLGAQLRYREAFDIAAATKSDDETVRRLLALRQANLLMAHLGEKDKGLEKLKQAAEEVKRSESGTGYSDLIRTELRLGLTDAAFEHCAQALANPATEPALQALEVVFPEHGTSAHVWWTFFRKKYPGEKEPATMKRLRELFAGKVIGKELAALAEELEGGAKDPMERAPRLLAIAEVCETINALDGTGTYLKKWAETLDSPAAWQRYGDFQTKHGNDWKETAGYYEKAYRKDVTQPLPLFLRGHALIQAGQKAEGRRLQELAHRVPLGDEEARYSFALGLSERGFAEDARREFELILRVGPGENWNHNEAIRHLAYEAMGRKDYRKAADLFERFRLCCLRVNTSFVEYSAYVHVPVTVHQNRARAALAAGKLDEAKQAVEQCLAALPGSVQLPIELIADLDRAGRTKDADQIFHRVFDLYEKRSTEYARSAPLHNSVAWLAAACRRELGKGLAHGEKAVVLAPKEAGYLDTLAEVCFQRGDKDRAVKLMKRCIELDPANDYFPRQLKRIEKGDRKAPLPEQG